MTEPVPESVQPQSRKERFSNPWVQRRLGRLRELYSEDPEAAEVAAKIFEGAIRRMSEERFEGFLEECKEMFQPCQKK